MSDTVPKIIMFSIVWEQVCNQSDTVVLLFKMKMVRVGDQAVVFWYV